MIRTVELLEAHVREELAQKEFCRVYSDVLDNCFLLSQPEQHEAVRKFAHEHGWKVEIHEPAKYGFVADFRHASPASSGEVQYPNS